MIEIFKNCELCTAAILAQVEVAVVVSRLKIPTTIVSGVFIIGRQNNGLNSFVIKINCYFSIFLQC